MQIVQEDGGTPKVALWDISFESCAAPVGCNLTLQLQVSNILTKLPIFLKLPTYFIIYMNLFTLLKMDSEVEATDVWNIPHTV